jgi:16S rRNA (adenine1518-N6/adenine1519-N6)-dimethyltransferase
MSHFVKPKKHLGQHFLKDTQIAENVALLFSDSLKNVPVLEIGPGMGVLTNFLMQHYDSVSAIEIDRESVAYLKNSLVKQGLNLIEGDFLHQSVSDQVLSQDCIVLGNFPYNISSQIIFKIIENKEHVLAFGGMFQKEVAERLVAKKGSKTYGILSVLLNAFYDTKYEFTVEPHVFIPPPKVRSGVISGILKKDFVLPCSMTLFFDVVKSGFNQRRKTLKNALHKFNLNESDEFAKLRAEQLSVEDFIKLTQFIERKI